MTKRLLFYLFRLCTALALLLLFLLPGAQAEELIKLNLDHADSIGTTLLADPQVKVEGQSALRISTLWPTTISLGEVSGLNVDNAKLVYQAKVKSKNLKGKAFLEMWCYVGGGQYFSRGLNSVVTGTTNWKTLQTPFLLQAGQQVEKVTFNIVINGKGTVWVDDLHLFKQPLR